MPNSKQLIILIHGMGDHTGSSFRKEVVSACNNSLSRYKSYQNTQFENEVYIESIGYNHIFEKMREEYKNSALDLDVFIKGKLGSAEIPSVVNELVSLQQDLGKDKFQYTHVLDVIFYLTLLGEKVRLYVAEELLTAMLKYHDKGVRVNVLAHSLGTAVIHDTLNKLYFDGYKDKTGKIKLDPNTLSIDMLWMFANVSPVITRLSGLTQPLKSAVKPGPGGCIGSLRNVFHRFDPFTLKFINRFDPSLADNWIEPFFFKNHYQRYKTEKVARMNTHGIGGYVDPSKSEVGGYLEDSLVCHDFLRSLFEFIPDEQEKMTGDKAFKHLVGEAREIQEFISELENSEASDFKKLIKMLIAFKAYLQDIDF
ncbi:hypothetical protein L4D76_24700 [Photobacterium sagamiensis]|uniref:hypothetical protein n=1 Tax=Photobacterium sagamiensis TaxID=2910241 RepID=UPI003D12406C